MKNKVVVDIRLETGNEPDEFEVHWAPINFRIDSDLYDEMVRASVNAWVSDSNPLPRDTWFELVMVNVREHDAGGALMDEYFDVIHVESEGGA